MRHRFKSGAPSHSRSADHGQRPAKSTLRRAACECSPAFPARAEASIPLASRVLRASDWWHTSRERLRARGFRPRASGHPLPRARGNSFLARVLRKMTNQTAAPARPGGWSTPRKLAHCVLSMSASSGSRPSVGLAPPSTERKIFSPSSPTWSARSLKALA